MNRRIVLISSVGLGLMISLTTLMILTDHNGGSKVTVSFGNSEPSNGQFPSYIPCERLDFAVQNDGARPVFLDVSGLQDEDGNWVPSLHILGHVKASERTQVYLNLPQGSHPRSVRIRVSEPASAVQKSRIAFKLLIEKVSGRYSGKQVWFDRLTVPAYQIVVKLDKQADQDRAANGSQPIRSEGDNASPVAGFRQ